MNRWLRVGWFALGIGMAGCAGVNPQTASRSSPKAGAPTPDHALAARSSGLDPFSKSWNVPRERPRSVASRPPTERARADGPAVNRYYPGLAARTAGPAPAPAPGPAPEPAAPEPGDAVEPGRSDAGAAVAARHDARDDEDAPAELPIALKLPAPPHAETPRGDSSLRPVEVVPPFSRDDSARANPRPNRRRRELEIIRTSAEAELRDEPRVPLTDPPDTPIAPRPRVGADTEPPPLVRAPAPAPSPVRDERPVVATQTAGPAEDPIEPPAEEAPTPVPAAEASAPAPVRATLEITPAPAPAPMPVRAVPAPRVAQSSPIEPPPSPRPPAPPALVLIPTPRPAPVVPLPAVAPPRPSAQSPYPIAAPAPSIMPVGQIIPPPSFYAPAPPAPFVPQAAVAPAAPAPSTPVAAGNVITLETSPAASAAPVRTPSPHPLYFPTTYYAAPGHARPDTAPEWPQDLPAPAALATTIPVARPQPPPQPPRISLLARLFNRNPAPASPCGCKARTPNGLVPPAPAPTATAAVAAPAPEIVRTSATATTNVSNRWFAPRSFVRREPGGAPERGDLLDRVATGRFDEPAQR